MSKHKAKPDYIDLDKDGDKKESMKKASKDAKKKPSMSKKRPSMSKKKIIKESHDITRFITSISAKKYALAHKYLKQVIEDKIKSRITSSLNKPLF